ncbi:MAG: hypothetical protein WA820_08470 [Bradyrhizobium sp.]|jgi:hypothetical protein
MTTRSRRETITFKHSFQIKGIDRVLPPGAYEVITDEEMIEGLSFASFRRVATLIMVPAAPPRGSTMEMISIGSVDLADAQRIDASAPRD